MPTYSFRAECPVDVERFQKEAAKAVLVRTLTSKTDAPFPDTAVEFQAEASLDELRDVIRNVVDGHVMLQTLRQCGLACNSLERDYDLH